MKIARKFDLATGEITEEEAGTYRRALEANPHAGDNVLFFSPKFGDPLDFAIRHKLGSHWRRVNGFGPDHPDRVLLRGESERAFVHGTKTLLMLDDIFSYKGRKIDYSVLPRSTGIWDLKHWIAANKGDFIGVPVRSVEETIKEIRKASINLHNQGAAMSQYCFASFGGAVMPYSQLFYDWNPFRNKGEKYSERREKFQTQQGKLATLYNSLHNRQNGIPQHNLESVTKLEMNRIIGMPILMRLMPTRSVQFENGAKGLKGNQSNDGDQTKLLVRIDMADAPAMKQTIAYNDLRERLVKGGHVYVMGAPSVSIDPEDEAMRVPQDEKEWHNLRIVVNDIERQVMPVGLFGPA